MLDTVALALSCFHTSTTTAFYTLSLHDALPISSGIVAGDIRSAAILVQEGGVVQGRLYIHPISGDRKSTRLNSSHVSISYAVFCLKKKKAHLAKDDLLRYVLQSTDRGVNYRPIL